MRTWLFCLLCAVSLIGKSQSTSYFQQDVDYRIEVSLNDSTHTLEGYLELHYKNNSPDALPFIYFHIWPNAYSSGTSAMSEQHLSDGDYDFYFSDSTDRGNIANLAFHSNEGPLKWEIDSQHIDICKVYLTHPLKSGQSIHLSTPFTVKIPSGRFSRLGHIGQSYQITQWYPKPAVYDIDGWHPMPYLSQGEFYSEFGSYHVEITLPENYVVGATGDLQNKDELTWMHQKAKDTQKKFDEGTLLTKNKRADMAFPKSSAKTKTLVYKQKRVHDFGWFADKRYHVLHDTVKLPQTGEVVDCWALFTSNEARLWRRAPEYIKDGLYYYSKWNGDYPYKQCTAVDGTISAGGGMEYPNVTVIGYSGNAMTLETTIVHEVGHNWFYGILGTNERDHAWMDEGLNTLNENRYLETKYPEKGMFDGLIELRKPIQESFRLNIFKNKSLHEFSYLINARRNYDQAIETPSPEYTSINYGGIVYSKTGIVFDYLKAYLGNDLFDQCMHAYFEKWKFKHPQPEDLRTVFEEKSGLDLSWFFEDVIQTTKTIDFKIKSVKKGDFDNYRIRVKSKGEINGPFAIGGMTGDSVLVYQWFDSIPENGVVNISNGKSVGGYKKLMIDPFWEIPELSRLNNTSRVKGLFKKAEPLRLQFLGGLEDPYKSTLYYAPALGFNAHDGVMTGLAFYNSVFPQKKFEFGLAPMFAWRSKSIVGAGFMQYNFPIKYGNRLFQNVSLATDYRQFSLNDDGDFYGIIKGKLDFELKRKRIRFSPEQHILLRLLNTTHNYALFSDATYSIDLNKPFYGLSGEVRLRYGQSDFGNYFVNAELEATNTFRYGRNLNKIDVRGYVGKFLSGSASVSSNEAFHLAGQYGAADYTYDHWYVGRGETNKNIYGQQMIFNQAGFKTFTPIVSNDWMAAINLDVELPVPIGLSVFADLGFYPVYNYIFSPSGFVEEITVDNAFDFGFSISLMNELIEVYVPLAFSDQIESYYDLNNYNFFQKIRYTFNIRQLNPLNRIKNIGN